MDYPIRSTGLIAAMLLSCPPAGSAAENQQLIANSGLPSLELLEFLGSFETDTGEWIDPAELMEPDFEQLLEGLENLESIENSASQTSAIDAPEHGSQSGDANSGDEI